MSADQAAVVVLAAATAARSANAEIETWASRLTRLMG
jgi:hypothetical protein